MSHMVRVGHSVIVLTLIVAMASVVGLAIHRSGNAQIGAGAAGITRLTRRWLSGSNAVPRERQRT